MDNKYILYVKSDCPYCKEATKLLKEKNEKFSVLDLRTRPRVLKEMKQIYDWSTVPMVFYKEGNKIELVGGFTDLSERLANG